MEELGLATMMLLLVLVSPFSNSQVTSTRRSLTVLSDAQQGSEFAVLDDSARRPAPAGNPTAGNPPPPATVEIGGIAVTLEELNDAIDTLVVSNPIMVKAPLEGRQPAGRPQVSRSGRHGTRRSAG